MRLTITLQKEVQTQEQAQQLYDLVCTKLEQHPEVTINGNWFQKLAKTPPE